MIYIAWNLELFKETAFTQNPQWKKYCLGWKATLENIYNSQLQWGAGNVYLLVLSSCKVNIAENLIAVMGL